MTSSPKPAKDAAKVREDYAAEVSGDPADPSKPGPASNLELHTAAGKRSAVLEGDPDSDRAQAALQEMRGPQERA